MQLVRDKHVIIPQHDFAKLSEEASVLVERKKTLLPVEANTLGWWMQQRATEIQSAVTEAEVFKKIGKPLLDQNVLRWRHTRSIKGIPIPQLALINPFRGDMLSFDSHNHDVLRGVAYRVYADVIDGCIRRGNRIDGRCRLSFTWKGVLPNDIRDLIRQEQSNYEAIQLLVESPRDQWVYQQRRNPGPRLIDPLVLGEIEGQLVFLGQFDPTPLEQYVSSEFTARQLTA